MNLGGNILLWVSMVWLPVLLCVLMVRDGKPRKNMVVGVTLPYSLLADPAVERLLGRFRREMWITCLAVLLPAVPACLIRSFGVSMTVWLVWILVVCVVFLMPYARCNAALRRLKAQRVGEKPGDEDRHWLWGMFYWNPQDPRLLVSARLGVGTTINLARRWGQAVAGLLALLLLGCPLVGVWIMGMERAPVELTVAEEAVVGSHYGSTWSVALGDIADAQLLGELPRLRRVAGTGLPSALTGKFSSEAWGRFTCCIDPREGPWLLLRERDGDIFLFGGSDPRETEAVFEAVRIPRK